MVRSVQRRQLIKGAAAGVTGLALGPLQAFAQAKDTVTIAWPADVPSWDPQQRTAPDAQGIYKAVFDQPIDQSSHRRAVPMKNDAESCGTVIPLALCRCGLVCDYAVMHGRVGGK